MLRLTKRIDLGILILTTLIGREGERVSATEISEEFALSRHMVANVLKGLARASVVTAERGVRGGYALARPPAQIRLLEVIEGLEGPMSLLDCCTEEGNSLCGTTTVNCTARPVIQDLNTRMRELFADVTVADFVGGGGVASAAPSEA
jgi:Rrf2 family protein